MSWDYQVPERSFDDVLLPLDLEDLALSRPLPGNSAGYQASWLLRKASLLDRVAVSDQELQDVATRVAWEARRAGLRLQREMVRELVSRLLLDEEVFENPLVAEDQLAESAVADDGQSNSPGAFGTSGRVGFARCSR